MIIIAVVVLGGFLLWMASRHRYRAQIKDTARAEQLRPYAWSGRYLKGGYRGRRKYRP